MANSKVTRVKGIYYASILVAAAALGIGYGLAGHVWLVLACGLLAAGWLWGERRGWAWISSAGLVLLVLAAAIGVLLAIAPGWAIVSICAALVGWDIGRFNRALAEINRINQAELLEKRYQRRLLTVVTLGALISTISTFIRLNFGFGIALILGSISIVGFSRAISYLRQESD